MHPSRSHIHLPFDPASLSLETNPMDGYMHAQINKDKRILLSAAIQN